MQISFIDLINQKLEEGDVELPVFDTVSQQVYTAVQSGEVDVPAICEIMQSDPILVSEVLRLANSSFFSGLSEVVTLQDAIVRLGMKQMSALVMSISQKRMYSASEGMFRSRMTQLWEHVFAASLSARWIADKTGNRKLTDHAHVATLLHDVGKLSLLRIIEDLAKSEELPLNDNLVDTTLDRLYCEHGAQLLSLWGLPESLCEVVRTQNDEEFDQSNILLSIVKLADKACAKEGVSDRPDPELDLESLPETRYLGIDEITLAELRISIEDMRSAA
ncbi:MAG: HDOD domain-containing protein [Granulosicoccus sp.]|nr:HDOD domain-containing protein [Granulosicoccus sp.]